MKPIVPKKMRHLNLQSTFNEIPSHAATRLLPSHAINLKERSNVFQIS
jgi:hypothetical protein